MSLESTTRIRNQSAIGQSGKIFLFQLFSTERSIALAYGMSNAGDERYLAKPAEGRRPAVIIDEEGLILKLLPDLATVDGQTETLASLV